MTATLAASAATVPPGGAPSTGGRFRPDIEGLRAFAVLAVLIYHLDPAWLPGGFAGVDVFFVISGFLISTHLRTELVRTGSLSLSRFWGRRITRLLPASTLVLLVTTVATVLVAPRFVWSQFGHDTAYAGSYSLNWSLAARSVDYLAEDTVPSTVQHYWSLAVEEQFYLVWPLVLVGLALYARRRGHALVPVLTVAASAIVVLSFLTAVLAVRGQHPSAYFTTTTRLWELGVGALVALALPALADRLTPKVRNALLGLGALGLIASVLLLTGSGWPAWPALLPTLSTAALILAGGRGGAVSRLLGLPPLVWVGGISYGIYLWHWPLITLARLRWDDFTLLQTLAVAITSLVLAWASRRFVEDPVRFSAWFRAQIWRPFALAALCLVLSVASGLSLALAGPGAGLIAPPGARPEGAAVLPARIDLTRHPEWSIGVDWVLPSPATALRDVPVAYADGCQQGSTDDDPLTCTYGDRAGAKTVALVGDSKALQWLPALDTWALGHGYRLVTYVKSSCPLADVDVELAGSAYPSCRAWSGAVTRALLEQQPDLVVTSQVRGVASPAPATADPRQQMVDGLTRTWSRLLDAGIAVTVLADTPQTGMAVYACVAEHPDALDVCGYDRATAVAASASGVQSVAVTALGGTVLDASGAVRHPGRNDRLSMIDLDDAVCPDQVRCPPVVGNVLIYRSGSHLTKTYVDTLAPRLTRLLDRTG